MADKITCENMVETFSIWWSAGWLAADWVSRLNRFQLRGPSIHPASPHHLISKMYSTTQQCQVDPHWILRTPVSELMQR